MGVRELELREVDEFTEEAQQADCSTICCGSLQTAATSAEAPTEVGAALSAKDMRTHWEVSLEGEGPVQREGSGWLLGRAL